jgi:hypothetical protein
LENKNFSIIEFNEDIRDIKLSASENYLAVYLGNKLTIIRTENLLNDTNVKKFNFQEIVVNKEFTVSFDTDIDAFDIFNDDGNQIEILTLSANNLKLIRYTFSSKEIKHIDLANAMLYTLLDDLICVIQKEDFIVYSLIDDKLIEKNRFNMKNLIKIENEKFEVRFVQKVSDFICLAVLTEQENKFVKDKPDNILNFDQIFYFLYYKLDEDQNFTVDKIFMNDSLLLYYDKIDFGSLKPKYQLTFFEPL